MKDGDRVISSRRPRSGTVVNCSESYRQMGVAVIRWDGDPTRYAENYGDLRVVSPLEELANAARGSKLRLVPIPPLGGDGRSLEEGIETS